MKNNQSGNVLFYILIGVALLAALSFAVTHTSRGTLSHLTREQSNLLATEIIEYSTLLGS